MVDECNEDCIRDIVKEEIEKIELSNAKIPKRKKNQWNIFLSDCSKKYPKEMTIGERAKACAIEYKELKNSKNDTIPK